MKISFWVPAIVLCAVSIAFCNCVQVGTVLFTTTDLVRRCWTENDKSVLRARLIMQDLLPDPDCIDFSNPKASVVLLDYFLACYEIINKFCYGKVQNLMYVALSDALGGYLRAYVLPAAKRSYYAGQIKYSEAEQIFKLYDNIRVFLKTSGGGWAEPQKLSKKNFHVSPLIITGGSYEACKLLRIIVKKGKLHCIDPHYSTKCAEYKKINSSASSAESSPPQHSEGSRIKRDLFKIKQMFRGRSDEKEKTPETTKNSSTTTSQEKVPKPMVDSSTNETGKPLEYPNETGLKRGNCKCRGPNCTNINYLKRVVVPLPMLDDCQKPHSIAVPFRDRPFRNLHTESSAFILEYYYVAVIKCFIAAGNTITDIKNFNLEFHSWLLSQVVPRLNDEQWYPGFGGVLRIIETIKKFGGESGLNEPSFHDTGYVFRKGVAFDVGDIKEGKDTPRNIVADDSPNIKRHVITAILVVSLLWLFLFCACAFYFQATRGPRMSGFRFSSSSATRTCSKSCSQSVSVSRSTPCAKEKSCKSMNLQFLVKFFKKRSKCDNVQTRQKDSKACWSVRKIWKNKLPPINQSSREFNKQEKSLKSCLELKGQGDMVYCKEDNYFKPILSCWPSRGCFGKKKIQFAPGGDGKMIQPQDQNSKVFLLWKKPSYNFRKLEKCRRVDKKLSKERSKLTSSRTGSMSYGDSYTVSAGTKKRSKEDKSPSSTIQTLTSPTNSSTLSKGNTLLSTTTMECFDDLEANRKPFLKSLILASTDESEYDDEASTCESDY